MTLLTFAEQINLVLVPDTLELQKVATEDGYDYYAIWDAALGWNDFEQVRVEEDATAEEVASAYNRKQFVPIY